MKINPLKRKEIMYTVSQQGANSMNYIIYNPQQEHQAYRYEVHCDAGVFGFRTQALALAYQAALN